MCCKKCDYFRGDNKICSFWNAGSNYGNLKKGSTDLSGCSYYRKTKWKRTKLLLSLLFRRI